MKLVTKNVQNLSFERFKEKCKNLFKNTFYMVSSYTGRYYNSRYIDFFDIKKIYDNSNSFASGFSFYLLDEGTETERLIIKKDNNYLLYSLHGGNQSIKTIFNFKKYILKSKMVIALSDLQLSLPYIEYQSCYIGYLKFKDNYKINYFDIISLNFDEENNCGIFKTFDGKEYIIKLFCENNVTTIDYNNIKSA